MTDKNELPQAVSIGARVLFEFKALDIEAIDLRGIKDVTDFFLVATCESEAQMQAILNELRKEFKAAQIPSLGVEYKEGVRWAVFDAGLDLMVHLFEEDKRKEISLNKLYADGKLIELNEEDFVQKTTKKADDNELV